MVRFSDEEEFEEDFLRGGGEEEEEEDDDEEEEEEDDIVECLDDVRTNYSPRTRDGGVQVKQMPANPPPPSRATPAPAPQAPMRPPPQHEWTLQQREAVTTLREITSHERSESACYILLADKAWSLEDAVNTAMDFTDFPNASGSALGLLNDVAFVEEEDDSAAMIQTSKEREEADITVRVSSLLDFGNEAARDALCNSVRQRLLFEDKKILWSDGACAMRICLHALRRTMGDLDLVTKAERMFIQDCVVRATSIMLDQPLLPGQDNFIYAITVVDTGVELALLLLQERHNALLLEAINLALQSDKALWRDSTRTSHYLPRKRELVEHATLLDILLHQANWGSGGGNPAEVVCQILVFARLVGQSAEALAVIRNKLPELPLKNDRALEALFREIVLKHPLERDTNGGGGKRARLAQQQQQDGEMFHFWFNELGMRPFSSTTSLEQRLFGLSQLERLVESLPVERRRSALPSITTLLFPAVTSSGQETDQAPPPPPPPPPPVAAAASTSTTVQEFTPELLCAWLCLEHNFVQTLVEITPMHTEILQRSKRIIKFLASENGLAPAQLMALWNLALAQHESCAILLFDIICEALVAAPARCATEFFQHLKTHTRAAAADGIFGFLQLFANTKRADFALFCADAEKRDALIDLLWSSLDGFAEASTGEVYGAILLLVPLLLRSSNSAQLTHVHRAMEEIAKEGSATSFRFVLFLRQALDGKLFALERNESGREEANRLFSALLSELSQTSTAAPVPRNELTFRLDFIIHLWLLKEEPVAFASIYDVFTLVERTSPLVSLHFLKEVASKLAPAHKLGAGELCQTFFLFCAKWDTIFAQGQEVGGEVDGELWDCFYCFFTALKQQQQESEEVESAMQRANEMVWQAALAGGGAFSAQIHDKITQVAIRATNTPLPLVLTRILSLLKDSLGQPTSADSRRIARCLAVLKSLGEDPPKRAGEWPSHALSAAYAGEPVTLTILIKLLAEEAETREVRMEHINLNTAIQDVIHLLQLPPHSLVAPQLFIDKFELTQHHLCTIKQLTTLQLFCTAQQRKTADGEKQQPQGGEFNESARMTLARCDDLFLLLHQIQANRALEASIRLDAHALLRDLPSRRSVLSHFEAEQDADVEEYVHPGLNYFDQVYRLEILYSVLNPASPFKQDLAKTAKTRFLSTNGGLQSVVSFLNLSLANASAQSMQEDGATRSSCSWGAGVQIVLKLLQVCHASVDAGSDLLQVCLEQLRRIFTMVAMDDSLCVLALRVAVLLLPRTLSSNANAVQMDGEHLVRAMVHKLAQSPSNSVRQHITAALEDLARTSGGPAAATRIWQALVTYEEDWPLTHIDFLQCLYKVKCALPNLDEELKRAALDRAWVFAQAPHKHVRVLQCSLEIIALLSEARATASHEQVVWLVQRVLFSPDHNHPRAVLKICTQLLLNNCVADEANRRVLCEQVALRMRDTTAPEWNFDSSAVLREEEGSGGGVPFAGLVNFGATCYLNSLVQQFFMSPFIRNWIMGSGGNAPLHVEELSEKQRHSNDLIRELRSVFQFLCASKRRSLLPRDLVETCKHLHLMHNVYSQNDVRDLCDKLVDFIECALLLEEQHEQEVKLGGRVLRQNIKEGCPHPPTTFLDSFLMLELEITGKADLETSLRDYFAVEKLDECLMCEECETKFPAHIRNELCLPLPPVLIIQLKRFQIDFETFNTVKLNDRLAFPMEIDLSPFTSNADDGATAAAAWYDLCGVLVHRGQAFSGHYYSFSKDRDSGIWYKFNDERVTQFDLARLDDECFGGSADASAYLLFYEPRAAKPQMQEKEAQMQVLADNAMLQTQVVLTSPELTNLMAQLAASELDNAGGEVQQVAMDLFLHWTCRHYANAVPQFTFQPEAMRARLLAALKTTHLLDVLLHSRAQQTRRSVLALAVLNSRASENGGGEAELVDCLLSLLSLAAMTKLPASLEDVLLALKEMLANGNGKAAREFMRHSGGLDRLIHFYYGGGLLLADQSPFTSRTRGNNNSASAVGGISNLLAAATAGQGSSSSSERQVFDLEEEVTTTAMPMDAEDGMEEIVLVEENSGSDGGLLLPALDWNWADCMAQWGYSGNLIASAPITMQRIAELTCSIIAMCISPLHELPRAEYREVSRSARLYNRFIREAPAILLPWWLELCQSDLIKSARVVADLLEYSETEENRFEQYLDALVGVLNLQDELQAQRVALCFPAILTSSRSLLAKFWGSTGARRNEAAMAASAQGKPPSKLTLNEMDTIERHCKLLAKLCIDVPQFNVQLRSQVMQQQTREFCAYEDDLTRLVLCFADNNGHQTAAYRLNEVDEILEVLADIAALPDGGKFLLLHKPTSLPLLDELHRYCLGARYLFDDKIHSTAYVLHVVDALVRAPGTVVEFQCRMSAKFAQSASSGGEAAPYYCIVLGKRPGDEIVTFSNKTTSGFVLFQRVAVPFDEVIRKQEEQTRAMEEDAEEEEVDDAQQSSFAANNPRRSKRIKARQVTQQQQQQPAVPGVIIKLLPNSVVVRLDSSFYTNSNSVGASSSTPTQGGGGETASKHSQLVELGEEECLPSEDPLVLEFPLSSVYASQAALCVLDHAFSIVRSAPIPVFDTKQCDLVHVRPLSLPIYPGERVGVYRAAALGFTHSPQWRDFDRNSHTHFSNYFSAQQMRAEKGTVLHTLARDNSRPGFSFRIRGTE